MTYGPKPAPAHLRVLRRIAKPESGCWIFEGGANSGGYGTVGIGSLLDGSRRQALAHRVVYEALIGPIPEGLVIDHLCRTPACVNPVHMEVVTQGENMRRGLMAERHREHYAGQTHCKRGHPLSGDNLYLNSKVRRCVACARAYERERAARSVA